MTVAPRYKNYADAWDTGVRISLDGHEISYFHAVDKGVDRVFVDHPSLRRGGIYGDDNGSYGDNWFRFSLLCQGAILAALRLPLQGKIYSNEMMIKQHFCFTIGMPHWYQHISIQYDDGDYFRMQAHHWSSTISHIKEYITGIFWKTFLAQ